MSRPRALLLDFGGVLTTDLWESIRRATRRAGLPQNAVLDLMRDDTDGRDRFVALERGEITQAEYEPYLAQRLGIPSEGLLASLCADLRPDHAMWNAVATLRASGVQVAVLSNSWGAGHFSPYAGWDLDQRVDAMIVSHEVGMRKPEPGIFTLTLDTLGVPADQAVFVDDIAANLDPARAMGMHVIHHTGSELTIARIGQVFESPLTSVPSSGNSLTR